MSSVLRFSSDIACVGKGPSKLRLEPFGGVNTGSLLVLIGFSIILRQVGIVSGQVLLEAYSLSCRYHPVYPSFQELGGLETLADDLRVLFERRSFLVPGR